MLSEMKCSNAMRQIVVTIKTVMVLDLSFMQTASSYCSIVVGVDYALASSLHNVVDACFLNLNHLYDLKSQMGLCFK